MSDVLIIGAGLGGLSTAVHLASTGRSVTVLEKNSAVGGKMNRFESKGYRFDTGPTLVTMPFVLRDLFRRVGRRLEDYLELTTTVCACTCDPSLKRTPETRRLSTVISPASAPNLISTPSSRATLWSASAIR